MASKGPAPRTARVRALHGLRPAAPVPPVPAAGEVTPPEGLSPGARAVWDRLAPDLRDKGVLDAWSAGPFGRLCWLEAKSVELRGLIDRDGLLVAGHRGALVKHKLLPVLRQVDSELVQLEGRFGLTPADRGRVDPVDHSARYRGAERLLT